MIPALRRRTLHQGHSHGPQGGSANFSTAADVHLQGSKFRLLVCFVLTASFLVLEAVAGLWTNSLALLSDAFHMLSDTVALGLGALAAHMSLRRPTPEKTFGYKRFEVVAAFANAILLFVLGVGTAVSALRRLWKPEPVDAGPMLYVAAAGLALNLGILLWLHRAGEEKNLNEEGVLWHVLGDALGSIAAMVAGGLMLWKGWMRADALAGLSIAGILVFGSQKLIRQSAHILVEGVPSGVRLDALRSAIAGFPQVHAMHDLHVWTLSGRELYLSAHIEVLPGALTEREVVAGLGRELQNRHQITHLTIQSGACSPEDCGNLHH